MLKKQISSGQELPALYAWLLLLSSDKPEVINTVLEQGPVFGEIYKDIVNFQFHPKELIGMYSEALRIMDQNTIKLMIDEQKEQLEEQKSVIARQEQTISLQQTRITQNEETLRQTSAELEQTNAALAEKDSLIAELKKQLNSPRPEN